VAAAADGLVGNRVIFASTPLIMKQLLAAGADDERVHLLEVATDATVFTPLADDDPRIQDDRCQVAVLADAMALQAEAANITQSSHVRLWDEIRGVAGQYVDDWREQVAAEVLQRAERASGVKLEAQKLRDRFVELIRCRLMPTLSIRSIIERLKAAGLEVAVWGDGWSEHDSIKQLVRGPIPSAERRNVIYNATAVVICPGHDDQTPQTVLDCLAAGGQVVCRAAGADLAKLHPQLHDVLEMVPHAVTVSRMVKQVKKMVADLQGQESRSSRARALVLERHTLADRLRTMRDHCAAVQFSQ